MYVVERATLLHDAVRRYLEGKLPACAYGYLSAYEGVAGARWHELGRVIEEVSRFPTAPEHILTASRSAFACQRDWQRTKKARPYPSRAASTACNEIRDHGAILSRNAT